MIEERPIEKSAPKLFGIGIDLIPTIRIDPSRLEFDGDISKAYSSDLCAHPHYGTRIKKPFQYGGKLWTVTEMCFFFRTEKLAKAWELIQIEAWNDETFTYLELCDMWDDNTRPRGDERGRRVEWKKSLFVFGAPVLFVGRKTAAGPPCCQLDMFDEIENARRNRPRAKRNHPVAKRQ